MLDELLANATNFGPNQRLPKLDLSEFDQTWAEYDVFRSSAKFLPISIPGMEGQ